jgi:transposase, IS5 family
MRPKERRDSGQNDFFRARLDQIVDIDHPLAKLGRAIAWRFLEERFGAVYSDKAGHPPLPTRLMAGLSISLTRTCAPAGSRTPITSSSAARSSSSTS